MIFPLHITVGQFRKLTENSPDAAPLFLRYGEVHTDLFARVDTLTAETPGKLKFYDEATEQETEEDYNYPCPVLTISLIDPEMDDDEEEEDEEDDDADVG